MKKLISLLIISLLIVGCGQNSDEEESVVLVEGEVGDYRFVIPFESNYVRFSHGGIDYKEIGKGLVDLSKQHYDPSKYYLKEGSILKDYRADYQPLLNRESGDNPYGLNPHSDTKVLVNSNNEVSGPLFVSDIYEINFVESKDPDTIAAVSIALVLNKTINDNGRSIIVDDKVLYDFGTEIAGPKLESYLRKKPELVNTPIMIAIFVRDSTNLSVAGNYVAKAEYINRQGKFEKVDHKWLLFPTTTSSSQDPLTNEQIVSLKRSVFGFVPEDIGIVAYGEYYDETLKNLKIDINVQTKTYTEILVISHYIGELIMSFDANVKIIAEVKSLDESLAIIKKPAGANKVEVIML